MGRFWSWASNLFKGLRRSSGSGLAIRLGNAPRRRQCGPTASHPTLKPERPASYDIFAQERDIAGLLSAPAATARTASAAEGSVAVKR